jgi:hypothetical protein
VSYAGLPSDENHALQQKYMPKGGGAVFTFGVEGGYDSGVKFVEGLEMFSHLANIGDTRSLIIHPASTTHRQLTTSSRLRPAPAPTWSACRSASRTSTHHRRSRPGSRQGLTVRFQRNENGPEQCSGPFMSEQLLPCQDCKQVCLDG